MVNKKIIAFYSPYPGAGKTTAAEHLTYEDMPWGYKDTALLSFAEPIQSLAAYLFAAVDLSFNYCWTEGKDTPRCELNNRSPRDVVTWLERSGREYMGSGIWAEIMRQHILQADAEIVVIDDLREYNEYQMLRDLGAKFVRITVPGREVVPSTDDALLEEDSLFDVQIVNAMNGLGDYLTQIEDACMALLGEDS